MKKRIIFFVCIICFIIVGFSLYNKFTIKCFQKDFYYLDTYINIKIYTNEQRKADKAFKYIDNLLKEYHQLTDRYNSYEGIINLYTINNNVLSTKYLEIDSKLYNLIKYGISLYDKSNGKIDISMGNIIDIWKGYRETGYGIPSIDELQYVNYHKITEIELKDNSLIKNNNLNIDLGCITKGYVTKEIGKYLEKQNLTKFIINAGGNVLVGDSYKKDNYKIGLERPTNTADIYKIIKVSNKAVVTSGGYLRYYEYNGKKYHHIIDPDTLFPSDYMQSVTVITSDSAYADFMSTYLFLLPVDEGLKIVNNTSDLEAIWYLNDDTIITSKGFKQYE